MTTSPTVKSGTLVPGTASSATVNAGDGAVVINRTGTGTIWVRIDGTAATVAGDNCYPVLTQLPLPKRGDGAVFSLISDQALEWTVQGTFA